MPDPVTTVITTVASSVISTILNDLANHALNEPGFSKDINSVIFKLREAQSYLKNVSRLEKHKVREIQRVAYCAEEAIEKILWMQQRRRDAGFLCSLGRSTYYHYKIRKTLCKINEEFSNIDNLIPGIFGSNSKESSTTDHFEDQLYEDPRETLYTISPHEVVGFDSLTEEIIKELEECSSNDKKHSVVSIFGMGGIGKSTLARKVFDKADGKHFPIKIWINVSQRYNVLSLRKQMLKSITGFERMETVSDNDVCDKLYKNFEKNRYLIVLDDIWETKSWNEIFYFKREPQDNTNSPKSLFPDMNNASRMILTTRKLPVAKEPNIKRFIHEVKPLGDDEGWRLLKEKALPSYVSVSDILKSNLENLGPEIAKKWKACPLLLWYRGAIYQRIMTMKHGIKWPKMSTGKKPGGNTDFQDFGT